MFIPMSRWRWPACLHSNLPIDQATEVATLFRSHRETIWMKFVAARCLFSDAKVVDQLFVFRSLFGSDDGPLIEEEARRRVPFLYISEP